MNRHQLLEQIARWHEEDQHQRIVDAISAIPEKERDYTLQSLLARGLMNATNPDQDGFRQAHERAYALLKSVEFEGLADYAWHYRMAWALYWLDREAEAVPHLRQALDLNPSDTDTAEFLERCEQIVRSTTILKPVTLARLAQSFDERDLQYGIDDSEEILFTGFGHNKFGFNIDEGDMQLRAVWGPDVPIEMRNQLLEACNDWNLAAKRPRAQVKTLDNGQVWACAEWFIECARGLTDYQFEVEMARFINTAQDFFSELDIRFPQLAIPDEDDDFDDFSD